MCSSGPVCISSRVSVQFGSLTATRMFRNYPLVALHDLFSFCLIKGQPDSTEEDGQLIYETRHNLQLLHHADFPDAYYARLEVGLKWCTGLLDTIKDCLSRSATASDWEPANGSSSSTGMADRTPMRMSTSEFQSEPSSLPAVRGQWNSATTLGFTTDADDSLHALTASVPSEGLLDPTGFPVFGLAASSNNADGAVLALNHGLDHPVSVSTMHHPMWTASEFPCGSSSESFFDADFTQSIMPIVPNSSEGV